MVGQAVSSYKQIARHGRDLDDGQTLHIPVCRVGFAGNMTTRALNEAILNFYNHPSADASRSRYLRNRNLAALAAESVESPRAEARPAELL